MKRFDPAGCCPKCGSDKVASVYQKWETYHSFDRRKDDMPQEEHIRRRCERCHYFWPERPVSKSATSIRGKAGIPVTADKPGGSA